MKKTAWLLKIILCFIPTWVNAQNPSAAAIATSHPLATQAGMRILEQGGNAFDAAVTIAAVLAVVEPDGSGLGGGGFWLLRDMRQGEEKILVLDAYEKAPIKATASLFTKNGEIQKELAQSGALAAAIPGEPAGIIHLAQHFGKLPLRQTLAPAIRLAQEGFPIDNNFARKLSENQPLLHQFPSTRAIFFAQGNPVVGTILKQPQLARVLHLMAEKGLPGFYQGEVAEQLVAGVQRAGGIWTLEDLQTYQIETHDALKGEYEQLKITTVPLPSAGGIGILTAFNILSEFEMDPLSQADKNHLIIETLRRVYCDRVRYLGDPRFVDVPVQALLSEQHAEILRASIDINHATKSETLACGQLNKEGQHTTHYVVLDQEGNAVSASLTNNHPFGSGFVPANTGILLNNGMDDFNLAPQIANGFNLMNAPANLIAPGKKPLSSMTPVFFENEQGFGMLGTPGGSRIPSMALLALLTAKKDFLPAAWVATPRFHHPYWPDVVFFEPEAFNDSMQHALQLRGHTLKALQNKYGNMQAIFWDRQTNKIYAAADLRAQGLALVKTIQVETPKKINLRMKVPDLPPL